MISRAYGQGKGTKPLLAPILKHPNGEPIPQSERADQILHDYCNERNSMRSRGPERAAGGGAAWAVRIGTSRGRSERSIV